MARPRIALVGRFAEHTSATRYAGIVSARALVESLWLAGAEPLTFLAAPGPDGLDWPSRLAGIDGVLLCGGVDVDPARYGETEVRPGEKSTHVLNAVSPAWTSSLAMAEWIVARITS